MWKAQPTQLAAVVIDGRKLSVLDKFNSYIKIELDDNKCKELGVEPLSEEVTKKTGITKEILEAAPSLKVVWTEFGNWVNTFNFKKDKWNSPIRAGFNILNYDDVLIHRICSPEYYNMGDWDNEYKSCTLFNPIFKFDIMDIWMYWSENLTYVKSRSLDALRELMGMDDSKAHDGLFDAEQSADILIRFLKLSRNYAPKVKFKDAFKKK